MSESRNHAEPVQLVLRDTSTSLPLEDLKPQQPKARSPARVGDKLQLHLGLLGPRLRSYAMTQQTSMAAVMRQATKKLLDDANVPGVAGAPPPFEHSAHNVHFHLNLPAAYSAELTARARAADMTRGEFVWYLLKGQHPPALTSDHGEAILALRVSTDRMAVISTDLSEYLRLVTQASLTRKDLERLRSSLESLAEEVGAHLRSASMLIKELKPYRRARW